MNKRRIISAAVLFVFVAVSLVVLNRVSFMRTPDRQPTPVDTDFSAPNRYKLELFDSERGEKRGEIVADRYTTLDDGSVEAHDISVELAETRLGDVSLTCERAILRLIQMDEQSGGNLTLAGNINLKSVRDGRPYVSGLIQELFIDSATREVSVSGPFEISSADGLSLSGVGLKGNYETMRFVVEKSVRCEVPVEEDPETDAGEAPARALIEAAGPMLFDGGGNRVEFSDAVVTSSDMRLEGDTLALDLTGEGSEKGSLPGAWELAAAEMSGSVHGTRGEFAVTGDRLYWRAGDMTAGITGAPAVLSGREGFVESPRLEVRFDEQGGVKSVEGAGPGRAFFTREAEGAGEEPEAVRAETLAVNWSDSLLYDSAASSFSVAGAVRLEGGDYRGEASRMTIRLDEEVPDGQAGDGAGTEGKKDDWFAKLAGRVSGVEAEGKILFEDDAIAVRGERVSYDRKEDRLRLEGAPASAEVEGASFSSAVLTFDRAAGHLSAEGGCTVRISRLRPAESPEAEAEPVVVRAGSIEADFAGGTLKAVCTGGVSVDWGESSLKCPVLTVSGATLKESDEGPPVVAAEEMEVAGDGPVVFKSGQVTGRCGSFRLDRGLGVLELKGEEGREVEVAHGETATFWSEKATVEKGGQTIVCEKPRAVLFAVGSLMGFEEPANKEEPGSQRPKTKVDLAAKGRMVLTRTSQAEALMVFDGGVKASRWDSRTPLEDMLECDVLELDLKNSGGAGGSGTGETALGVPETAITAGRAKGSVYLRYAGANQVLEGRGDSFEWDKESRQGRLKGSQASVWVEKEGSAKGREFIYDFLEGRIEARGVTEGRFVMNRLPAK